MVDFIHFVLPSWAMSQMRKRLVRRMVERWLIHVTAEQKSGKHALETVREMALEQAHGPAGISQSRTFGSRVIISDYPADVARMDRFMLTIRAYHDDYYSALVARVIFGSFEKAASALGWSQDRMIKSWHTAFGMLYLMLDMGLENDSSF